MAIYHTSIEPVCRSKGHSAVAKAAYVTASRLVDERTGIVWDFSKKKGVIEHDIVFPPGTNGEKNNQKLWNMAEFAENQKNSRTAKEIRTALPYELTDEQRKQLTLDIVEELVQKYQVAVTYAIHAPTKKNDPRNYHIHLVLTTRVIKPDGTLGRKSNLELSDEDGLKIGVPRASVRVRQIRKMIADKINQHLQQAEINQRVDHRSYKEQGIELQPGIHLGRAYSMAQRGIETRKARHHSEIQQLNLETIAQDPKTLLHKLTVHNQTFSVEDLADSLSSFDKPSLRKVILESLTTKDSFLQEELNKELAKYATSPELLKAAIVAMRETDQILFLGTDERGRKRYTTAESLHLEQQISNSAHQLHKRIDTQNPTEYLTSSSNLSCLLGKAGTGKSTQLKAANEIWVRMGKKVIGLSLSGVATDNLNRSSGIQSQTLASFKLQDKPLSRNTILVLDEAGMVDSRTMNYLLQKVNDAGAKLVLVGDPMQLQPINAGTPFKAVLDQVGYFELNKIYRQEQIWQKEAVLNLSRGNVVAAVELYYQKGQLHLKSDAEEVLVQKYLKLAEGNDFANTVILTHLNKDVQRLNEKIRLELLAKNKIFKGRSLDLEVEVNGKKKVANFCNGDRVVFLKNDRKLGVRNGTMATIIDLKSHLVSVVLDDNKVIRFNPNEYKDFNYGYALTIHKAQGLTVSNTLVYLGNEMNLNRHLAYVALSRHKKNCEIFHPVGPGMSEFQALNNLKVNLSRKVQSNNLRDYIQLTDDYNSRRFQETNPNIYQKVGNAIRSFLGATQEVKVGELLIEAGGKRYLIKDDKRSVVEKFAQLSPTIHKFLVENKTYLEENYSHLKGYELAQKLSVLDKNLTIKVTLSQGLQKEVRKGMSMGR